MVGWVLCSPVHALEFLVESIVFALLTMSVVERLKQMLYRCYAPTHRYAPTYRYAPARHPREGGDPV